MRVPKVFETKVPRDQLKEIDKGHYTEPFGQQEKGARYPYAQSPSFAIINCNDRSKAQSVAPGIRNLWFSLFSGLR